MASKTIRRIKDVNSFGREFYWEAISNPTGDPMVGLFGHEMGETMWNRQFRIVDTAPGGYLVQMYSVIDGTGTDIEVWSADRVSACRYFKNPTVWREVADEESRRFYARQREEIDRRFERNRDAA